MATKKSEVATQESNVPALSQDVPEWAKNGQGRGSENVGSKDLVLPRLEIVQSTSPIKDTKPDEAKEGLLFNTVTQEVVGDLVFIIPIYYRMEYIVWKAQDAGGGFFGAFDTEQEALARVQELRSEDPSLGGATKDGKPILEVVDTPVHYCLRLRADGTTEQIVISMPKSKAKVSRKWNATIQIVGGDRFARAYKVSTFKDKNKQNKTFYNYVIQPAGFPPEAVYREAERLYNVFRTQGVKADHAAGGTGESDEHHADI